MTASNPLLEIAIRKVKEGQLETFTQARSIFIDTLKKQEGVLFDREFQSFYALPQPDETEVFVGMTYWASPDAAQAAGAKLLGTPTAQNFFGTFDFKAYVMAQPVEGPEFDLSKLATEPGQVLEIAVRSVNEGMETAFQSNRAAFVNLLSEQEGALESYEFHVMGENEQRLTVGITVYESQEAFQRIAASIMEYPVTQSYFSTFTPVALQYAVSVQ